jgi:carboxyl-terminal processing protease
MPVPPPSSTSKKNRALFVLLAIGLSFGAGFGLGQGKVAPTSNTVRAQQAAAPVGAPTDLSKDVDFRLFWEVWTRVKSQYVKQPVADTDLFQGALEGMVAALGDPYSVYFKPQLAEEFSKDLAGTFEGIGAEIGIKGGVVTVIAPLPETPASKAGLRAGDKILSIGDRSTAGMAVDEAVNLIRGKGGTVVSLSLLRTGVEEPIKLDITRSKIVVKSVRWETKKTKDGSLVGWIQVRQFNDETASLFHRGVRELLKESPKGMIVDLRNDPGGYLDAAVDVAGAWMQGAVVIERKYDGTENAVETKRTPTLTGMPTVVLVNQGSASASEILAGALQDVGAATLVGMKTFGKGSVQDYQQLEDGSALKITIAEWLTPKKRSINKEGITPDVEIDLTDEDANADKDPQLDKALELIQSGGAKAANAH